MVYTRLVYEKTKNKQTKTGSEPALAKPFTIPLALYRLAELGSERHPNDRF